MNCSDTYHYGICTESSEGSSLRGGSSDVTELGGLGRGSVRTGSLEGKDVTEVAPLLVLPASAVAPNLADCYFGGESRRDSSR